MNAKNGTIYIVLTALAFGTMEIALKIAGSSFTTFQLTFLRFFIGGLLLLPLAVKDLIRRHVHLTTSDWGYIAVLGIINVMFSMVLFQIGVNNSNAGLAAIVFSCNPVFTMIFSYFITHDALTRQKIITIILSLIGLCIVANPVSIIENGSMGLLIVLAAAISFSLYTTLGKLRIKKIGGSAMNSFSFIIGAIGVLAILFFTHGPVFSGIDSHSIWPLLYTSVVVTGVGYVCFMKAIELSGPANASFAFFIKPVVALILASIVLGEPITLRAIIGLALIIAGCVLAGPIERLLFKKKLSESPVLDTMPKKASDVVAAPLVVTVSREFGSGGRAIGRRLAKELGVPFYDTEIMQMVGQREGLSLDEVKKQDQSIENRFIYNLFDKYTHLASGAVAPKDELFLTETSVIKELAEKGSCVIVGRLANVILKDRPNTFNLFISSDPEWAARRVMLREKVDKATARRMIADVNRRRSEHCRYYTGTFWGYAGNYDLLIKSSEWGIADSIQLIMNAIRHRLSLEVARDEAEVNA